MEMTPPKNQKMKRPPMTPRVKHTTAFGAVLHVLKGQPKAQGCCGFIYGVRLSIRTAIEVGNSKAVSTGYQAGQVFGCFTVGPAVSIGCCASGYGCIYGPGGVAKTVHICDQLSDGQHRRLYDCYRFIFLAAIGICDQQGISTW